MEPGDAGQVEITERLRLDEDDYDRAAVERLVGLLQRGAPYRVRGDRVEVGRLEDRSLEDGRARMERDLTLRLPPGFSFEGRNRSGDFTLRGLRGRVSVRSSSGDIRVRDVAGDVDVRTSGGELDLERLGGALDAHTSGGDILVRGGAGRMDVDTSGGRIRIRDAGDGVRARTSGGDVEVTSAKGAVDARTSGGNVEVRDVTADVAARTSGGDVEVENITGAVEARTSGGDIRGRRLGGRVEAVTSAGDIELDGVGGSLDARTSVGDIRVRLTPTRDADYAARLEASHGDVELTIPGDLPARIEAELRLQGGRYGNDDIYSAFPLSRETPESRYGVLRSHGPVNGGGPLLELRTAHGSIRIKKD